FTTPFSPTLTNNLMGWNSSGLRIKARTNTFLSSFVVNNQGRQDMVRLTDINNNTISSVSVPAGNTTYTANVSWPLTAGTSYNAVLDGAPDGNNGKWLSYSAFPQPSSRIEVDGSYGFGLLMTDNWFTFTSLKTACQCAPTPVVGPSLTNNLSGWSRSGLRIKALSNTTLTGFTINNQGKSDTVRLTDTVGNVLQTLTVVGGTNTQIRTVSWPLTAGTSYELTLDGGSLGNNGRWVAYTSWPTVNSPIEVDGSVDSGHNLQTQY